MKLNVFLPIAILGSFSSLAMADSFNLENPDGLRYQLKYGETVVKEGKDTRFYDSRNPVVPQKNISISVEDENGTNIAEKSVPSSLNGNSRGCNYSMIVTSHHGWRITGNCIETEGNYKPDAPHIYTVENNSKKKVYPAFSVDKANNFSSDSVLGYLNPHETRLFSVSTDYWKATSIKEHSMIQVGFYNPFTTKYIPCGDKTEEIDKDRVFTLNEDLTCSIK
ncbi:TPA: hypothetical protein ACQVMA_005415 [Serratia marcescens]|uniref:Uncharacterized protein n=5 Tax=Serratia TaxID=613 RepID=A0AAW6WZJ8_9GAMM|nr:MULTISPECIES: hypothetical protein [Serratia]EGT3594708.1 hypothetical protein [Serratia marcescens]MBH2636808.1 hypothetical protein [Serratia marcescens]MDF8316269.1 hypothetical protein [Serratia nevei]MDI9106236.1 hypothetical protein [Serratia marcescens]MDK4764630.1 hypothetical protein [Serratia nevei]